MEKGGWGWGQRSACNRVAGRRCARHAAGGGGGGGGRNGGGAESHGAPRPPHDGGRRRRVAPHPPWEQPEGEEGRDKARWCDGSVTGTLHSRAAAAVPRDAGSVAGGNGGRRREPGGERRWAVWWGDGGGGEGGPETPFCGGGAGRERREQVPHQRVHAVGPGPPPPTRCCDLREAPLPTDGRRREKGDGCRRAWGVWGGGGGKQSIVRQTQNLTRTAGRQMGNEHHQVSRIEMNVYSLKS